MSSILRSACQCRRPAGFAKTSGHIPRLFGDLPIDFRMQGASNLGIYGQAFLRSRPVERYGGRSGTAVRCILQTQARLCGDAGCPQWSAGCEPLGGPLERGLAFLDEGLEPLCEIRLGRALCECLGFALELILQAV